MKIERKQQPCPFARLGQSPAITSFYRCKEWSPLAEHLKIGFIRHLYLEKSQWLLMAIVEDQKVQTSKRSL
jgi:hypothetical protein